MNASFVLCFQVIIYSVDWSFLRHLHSFPSQLKPPTHPTAETAAVSIMSQTLIGSLNRQTIEISKTAICKRRRRHLQFLSWIYFGFGFGFGLGTKWWKKFHEQLQMLNYISIFSFFFLFSLIFIFSAEL